MPALAISSTDCRARVGRGHQVWYLVPDGVVQYIEKRRLYRGGRGVSGRSEIRRGRRRQRRRGIALALGLAVLLALLVTLYFVLHDRSGPTTSTGLLQVGHAVHE